MSFPRYPKYKDSGVEWLGEVPEHWDVRKLGHLFQILKRIAGTLGYDVFSITQNGIRVKDIESNEGQQAMDYSKYQLVHAGDFAMNPMDLITGGADIATYTGVTSPDYRVCSLKQAEDHSDRYLLYLFQNAYRRRLFYPYGQGSSQLGRWRFPRQQFNAFSFPVPPRVEQSTIAAFLDRETAQIDALIAEQQRLIELLQEKRQAVISHAVTKGLNPDVPMKDSGIEWQGDVPRHWTLTRLDRISDFVNGKAHEPYVNDDGPFICVTSRFISTNGEAVRLCSENLTPAVRDDILMVMSDLPNGRALARTFHVQDDSDYAINQRVCAIRPTGASPRYLAFLLDRNPWFLQNDDGMNQTHLSVADFRKMPIVLPPKEEQDAIGKHLDSLVAVAAGLIDRAETCVTLLQERRSALISAAVTGQIDVRGFVESEAA